MIARNIVLFLLLLVLPYLYIDLRYFRRKKVWWKRVLLYVPCVTMVAYAIYLAMGRDFIPDNDHIFVLYGFLLLLGFVIIPQWTFILSSLIGKRCSKLVRKFKSPEQRLRPAKNYGNLAGIASIPLIWGMVGWGSSFGFELFDCCGQGRKCSADHGIILPKYRESSDPLQKGNWLHAPYTLLSSPSDRQFSWTAYPLFSDSSYP